MAVIEISKILVRRGQETVTGIPNLDPGEFGWAEDTKHLYIGRSLGGLGDGRETPTRVLTEPDLENIFTAIGNITTATTTSLYTYRGEDQYLANNTLSNFQIKLDSLSPTLYDFGVTYNPSYTSTVENITLKLQNAITDLFKNEQVPSWIGPEAESLRRQLVIPAGTFIVSGKIVLPPYTSLVGAGPDKTKIIFDSTASNLFETIDMSGNDWDSGDMQSGAIRAREIYIGGMTLEFSTSTSANNSLISIDNVLNARIENCVLKSNNTSTFENYSTSSYTIKSSSTVVFYVENTGVNYFAGQELIVYSTNSEHFLRGEVIGWTTGTGELVMSSLVATQQFGTTTAYDYWTIKLDNYLTTDGYAIHGIGVQLRGTGGGTMGDVNLCQNITIRDCIFDGLTTGIQGFGSVERIIVENNIFNNLESGIKLLKLPDDPTVSSPTNAHVLRNKFENIIKEGFYVDENKDNKPTYHLSEGNTYIRVGNGIELDDNVQATSSGTSVITFLSPGNKSINDYFSRRIVADETTDPLFYYFPLVNRLTMVKDDAIRQKTIESNSVTSVLKFYLTGEDQKIDVNYQMIGNGLSRKGNLLLNIAPDGYVSYTDYYNYSQTVQELPQAPFYVTDVVTSSTFTVERTTATSYMDVVQGTGNWYVVAVDDAEVGGQVISVTTATSTGTLYSTGSQYYTFVVAPAPFIDFTTGTTSTLYNFAYSDFLQPTFNFNQALISTLTNWVSLESISQSEFDMILEFRIDQQL